MRNLLTGIVLLAAGGLLIWFGLEARETVESQLSETLTGEMSDSAKYQLIGGGACALLGAVFVFLGLKRRG